MDYFIDLITDEDPNKNRKCLNIQIAPKRKFESPCKIEAEYVFLFQ